MNVHRNLTGMIGKTPLLRLERFAGEWEIFAKCEFMNPMSLKDRPILQIIQDAEQSGLLNPGSTLIEMTSGNTGMAVAYIAAIMGYNAILVMSEIQSLERRKILAALGAELILTPASMGTEGARQRLKEILIAHPEYFYVGQHTNSSNLKAHYQSTGPEIWEDTGGRVDFLVAGLGTGGTICGAGRYLKEMKPEVRLVAVEPAEITVHIPRNFQPSPHDGYCAGLYP